MNAADIIDEIIESGSKTGGDFDKAVVISNTLSVNGAKAKGMRTRGSTLLKNACYLVLGYAIGFGLVKGLRFIL